MRNDDLIIPDVYDPDLLTAVAWFQEHLPFSDEYLAQLIEVPRELFSEWKKGDQTLTISQTQTLEKLSTAISRLLSFYGFRRHLVVRVLEIHTDNQGYRNKLTPPWVGNSLKNYMLLHRAKGIAEVDAWLQNAGSANP